MAYDNLYVPGDSLSDTGAFVGVVSELCIRTVKFPPPFFQGRSFSNGPLAVEYVAEKLNLPLHPAWRCITPYKISEQQGTNYAMTNAMASQGNKLIYHFFFNQFQLKHQRDLLMKQHPCLGKNDLVIIMAGGNDAIHAGRQKNGGGGERITAAITEIQQTLISLAAKAVKTIVVVNMPDLGIIPYFIHSATQTLATTLSRQFNQQLNSMLHDITGQYPGVSIKYLDVVAPFSELVREFEQKDFDTTHACLSDISDNQDMRMLLTLLFRGKFQARYNHGCDAQRIGNYLFFDYFHPASQAHQRVGKELYRLIMTD